MWFFHLRTSRNDSSNALKLVFFLLNGKKTNIVPIHEKGDKQTLENYRPVSVLPICGKILERLLFNEIINFFIENKLSSNQSGFKLRDSCINKLLCITHEIYQSFDVGREVRASSLIYQKHWIRCAMMVSFRN